MREVNFLYYVEHVVAKEVKALEIELPVILVVDNHTSHFSTKVSQKCEELGIVLVCLYPNSTHVTQPLDVSVFSPLKQVWAKYVFEKKFQQTLHSITAKNFARHFTLFLRSIDIKPWVVSGFRACGIFPWDFKNIDYGKIRDGCQRKKRQLDTLTWANSVYSRWLQTKATKDSGSSDAIIACTEEPLDLNSNMSDVEMDNSEEPLVINVNSNMSDIVVTNEDSLDVNFDDIPIYFGSPIESDLHHPLVSNESSMDSGYNCDRIDYIDSLKSQKFFDLSRSDVTYEEIPPCHLQKTDYFVQQGVAEFAQYEKAFPNPQNEIKNLPLMDINDENFPLDLTTHRASEFIPDVESATLPENSDDKILLDKIKEIFSPSIFKMYAKRNFRPENKDQDILQRLALLLKPLETIEDCLPLPEQSFRATGSRSNAKNTPIISDASFRVFRGEQERLKFEKELALTKQKEEKQEEKKEQAKLKALEEAAKKKQQVDERNRKSQKKLEEDLQKKLAKIAQRSTKSKQKGISKTNKNIKM